jgi:hypothetical protein
MTVAIVSKEIGQKRRVEWRVVSRLKGGECIYICIYVTWLSLHNVDQQKLNQL